MKINLENWQYSRYENNQGLWSFLSYGMEPVEEEQIGLDLFDEKSTLSLVKSSDADDIPIEYYYLNVMEQKDLKLLMQRKFKQLSEAIENINSEYDQWDFVDLSLHKKKPTGDGCDGCQKSLVD